MSSMAKIIVSLTLIFLSSRVSSFTLSITGRGQNCVPAHPAQVMFSSDTINSFSTCVCDVYADLCELDFTTVANRQYMASSITRETINTSERYNRHIFSCTVLNFDKAEVEEASIECKRQYQQNYSCIGGDRCDVEIEMCSIVHFPKQFCNDERDIVLIWESFQDVTIGQGEISDQNGIGLQDIKLEKVECHDFCIVTTAWLPQIDEDEDEDGDTTKPNIALILGLVFGVLIFIIFISVGVVFLVSYKKTRKGSKPSSALDNRQRVHGLGMSTPAQYANAEGNFKSPEVMSSQDLPGQVLHGDPKKDTLDTNSTADYDISEASLENATKFVLDSNDQVSKPTPIDNYNNAPGADYDVTKSTVENGIGFVSDTNDQVFKPMPIGNFNNDPNFKTPPAASNVRIGNGEKEIFDNSSREDVENTGENDYSKLGQHPKNIRNPYDHLLESDDDPNSSVTISLNEDMSGYSLAEPVQQDVEGRSIEIIDVPQQPSTSVETFKENGTGQYSLENNDNIK